MAALILVEGGERRRIPLQKDRTDVGRQEGNDLVLPDAWISRLHASLARRGNRYFVVDHQSRFGVFVNGERVAGERGLEPGDTIAFGSTSVVFEDISTDAAQASPMLGQSEQPLPQQLAALKKELLAARRHGKGDSPQIEKDSPQLARLERWVNDMEGAVAGLQRAHRTSATLLDFTRVIAFVMDPQVLMNLILEAALRAVRARAGAVAMIEGGKPQLRVTREPAALQPFVTMAQEVVRTQVAVRAGADGRPVQSGVTHAFCAPMRGSQRVLGVILAAQPHAAGGFSQEDMEILTAMANQSAVALEKAELFTRVRREERIRSDLSRYLSEEVVEAILQSDHGLSLGGESRVVTTLFCDIRNFTTLSERLPPAQVLQLLNAFYSEMNAAVHDEEGTIDKYIGDCLMAVFGAPIAHGDDPARAVKAALVMRAAVPRVVAKLGSTWQAALPDFAITIGINTGPVIAGNVGSERRMDYTVIGDAVNVASRLQSVAQSNQILVGEETYQAVRRQFALRKLPLLTVKGKTAPVQAYEVQGDMESAEFGEFRR